MFINKNDLFFSYFISSARLFFKYSPNFNTDEKEIVLNNVENKSIDHFRNVKDYWIKGVDQIRFVNSGTEAVMTMIKASRAYTGRTKIAKAEGTYHGTYDYAEISQSSNPTNWGDVNNPSSTQVVDSTPKSVLKDVIIFPFITFLPTFSKFTVIFSFIIDCTWPIPHSLLLGFTTLSPGSKSNIIVFHL